MSSTNEGTTPLNTPNHESCSSRWKKHLHPSLNKWHQALLVAASRNESGANYYDERRNCIWRAAQNPLSFIVVGKFVKGGCYLKIHLNIE
ncbi:nodulin-26-like [Pyrus ussuriensis x Pyrus communis]|uniref:Nodulin-26-like n=1 Tax=Pyrus ussuriensis x Pyrus communis TaxID=2448454 RepID=A0A5N5HAN2_9ROSA|nr:nodulin-26-like [Pyrus ussuriensis x Pyrus communis]